MVTILLIGYQTRIFEPFVGLLEQAGYKVLLANHDYEGVQLAREHGPAVIVYDVMMPTMNGKALQLVLKLAEHTTRIPFVFLVETAESQSIRDGQYLRKPFAPDDLLQVVQTLTRA